MSEEDPDAPIQVVEELELDQADPDIALDQPNEAQVVNDEDLEG